MCILQRQDVGQDVVLMSDSLKLPIGTPLISPPLCSGLLFFSLLLFTSPLFTECVLPASLSWSLDISGWSLSAEETSEKEHAINSLTRHPCRVCGCFMLRVKCTEYSRVHLYGQKLLSGWMFVSECVYSSVSFKGKDGANESVVSKIVNT